MKVRGDFVTNSSSSSYGALRITCRPLAEMIENYDRTVRERGLGEFIRKWGINTDSARGEVLWDWDEWSPFSGVPHSLDEVLSVLCEGIITDIDYGGCAPVAPLIRAIAEHRDELEDAIEKVEWDNTDQGWGGDDESRYDRSSYSPEMLAEILEGIAAEKGCSPDEVSDYDFNITVGNETSLDEDSFVFDRAKGIEKFEHSFGFL